MSRHPPPAAEPLAGFRQKAHLASLSAEQARATRQAAEQAYDEARWQVGDSFALLGILQRLAHDSYLAGLADERKQR